MSQAGISPGRGGGPRLSIVVPTVSDTAALEETLVSVLENRPADCEVVVPLGCDYDDPWGIGDEVTLVRRPATSLVACINSGLEVCRGSLVHVLAAGWRATPGWTTLPLAALANGAVAVAPIELEAGSDQRVAAAGVRVSRGGRRTVAGRGLSVGDLSAAALGADAPTLPAGFWRLDLLERVGGFSDRCGDRHADADMAAVLAAAGGGVVVEPGSRIIQGRLPSGAAGFTAARHAERLFWRSLSARPTLGGLVCHGAETLRSVVARGLFGCLGAIAGRTAGWCEFGSCRERSRVLREIAAETGAAADAETDCRTVRIDAAETVLTGPRREDQRVPLRRSA